MIRRLFKRVRELFSGREETILDFLGLRALDLEQGILVLPDHIAAVIDLGGTDYIYSSVDAQAAILEAWRKLLNDSRMSIQLMVDVRPARWDIPGGYIDIIERQLPVDSADPWYRRRFEMHRNAILRGEIDAIIDTKQLRQLAIIRYAVGDATKRDVPGESAAYQSPPEPWRFWEKVSFAFAGSSGLSFWRSNRRRLAVALDKEVRKFVNDTRAVPGMSARRLRGVELVQLLHLLWRDDAAYDEWIGDTATLEEMMDDDDQQLEIAHPGPLLPASEEAV